MRAGMIPLKTYRTTDVISYAYCIFANRFGQPVKSDCTEFSTYGHAWNDCKVDYIPGGTKEGKARFRRLYRQSRTRLYGTPLLSSV